MPWLFLLHSKGKLNKKIHSKSYKSIELMSQQKGTKNKLGNGIGIGSALGVAFGAAYGHRVGNMLYCIALGLSIGTALGALFDFFRKEN